MKRISLTQGKYAYVDDEDYESISRRKWYAKYVQGSNTYVAMSNDYSNGKGRSLIMHRVITKAPGNMVVDHINHNTLDNQRSNLRVCSKGENNHNYSRPSHNSSGFKGVDFYKAHKRFRARVQIKGKSVHLGYFDTAKEAAEAYNDGAVRYFGEFALLNKI